MSNSDFWIFQLRRGLRITLQVQVIKIILGGERELECFLLLCQLPKGHQGTVPVSNAGDSVLRLFKNSELGEGRSGGQRQEGQGRGVEERKQETERQTDTHTHTERKRGAGDG